MKSPNFVNKSFQFKFKFHVNSAVSKNADGALMLASDVLTAGFYCYTCSPRLICEHLEILQRRLAVLLGTAPLRPKLIKIRI